MDLSQIIIWILWRLRPVLAVEANLGDIVASGLAMFADDNDLALMEDDPDHCAMILAGIADANVKLDMLIYLRACEILGVRSSAKAFKANRVATRSGRTPQECWARFRRLVIRFQDYERLAQKRAERLQREQANSPLRLAASLQSTSPMLRMVEDSAILLEVLPRRRRGRWIGASSRRDGGGCAFPRGPPTPSTFENQNPHLAGSPARTPPHAYAAGVPSGFAAGTPPIITRPPAPAPTPSAISAIQ